jgi:YidC/Oxa1 family membrane protein insertase
LSLDWIYWAISWILLRWHGVWDAIGVPEQAVLGTNWSWILAIIFLVVTVRVILFPVFVKQIKSQRAMQKLAPQIKQLQEKHKGDRETLQKEMMELYRKEKANPLMGCLPMVFQVPVFLALFHTLKRLNPERTKGTTAYGWTHEQFHDASVARLFDAPIASTFASGGGTSKIVAGVLVIMMIITTYLTSKQMILKTGWSEDPTQKMMQKLMLYGIPASLLFSGYLFPIGVVIYWVVQNMFSMGQQFWVLKKFPPPPMATRGAVTGRKPAATTTAGKTAARTPGRKSPGIGRVSKDAAARMNEARRTGANVSSGAGEATAAQKALAPKPGAKPVNPKKGGAARAKRPAG